MFNQDQKAIGAYARECPENFRRVALFVIATIRQPLYSVPDAMAEIDEHGAFAPCLWGFKREAYDWLEANAGDLYESAMQIWHSLPDNEAAAPLVSLFADVPGLGLAKGGFLAQLAFGLVGCLDSHNLKRFGIPENAFKACKFKNAKTAKTRRGLVTRYLEACEAAGGCARLWDEWCTYVAENQSEAYHDARHVSFLHCEAIGIA